MTPGRNTALGGQRSAARIQRSAISDPSSARPGRRSSAQHSALGTRYFRRGFTLIEMLIVVTIIGILVTLAQPSFNRAVTAAKEATLKENLFILRDVIDQFYADNTKYPTALTELVEKGYIRHVPKDPITGSAETWVIVPATDENGQQVGVFDVKSGSDRTARDGSNYSDW
jgi:general secretion pathway protein G